MRRRGRGAAAGGNEDESSNEGAQGSAHSISAGLDDLITELPLDDLILDPQQPRNERSEVKIRELADSIRQMGVLQPLLVRPAQGQDSLGKYWVIAGGNRMFACRVAGRETAPCMIRDFTNQEALVVALMENIHRDDLSDLEKAEALQRLKIMTDSTWEDLAVRVGLSVDYLRRVVGLLKLEPEVKQLVLEDKLPVRTAIALRPLPPDQQVEMANRAVDEGLSMEQVRAATQAINPQNRRRFGGQLPPVTPYPSSGELTAELAEGKEPQPEDPEAGSGPVTASPVIDALREIQDQIQGMLRWLKQRPWTPSRVTPSQRQAFAELYLEIQRLESDAQAIRQSWLDADQADPKAAEQRRRRLL